MEVVTKTCCQKVSREVNFLLSKTCEAITVLTKQKLKIPNLQIKKKKKEINSSNHQNASLKKTP